MKPIRFETPDELSDPRTLAMLLGPVAGVERAPMTTVGFTGALHERWTVRLASGESVGLVSKHVRPSSDWVARLTGDTRGREVCLLEAPELHAVWEAFDCPYIAFAPARDGGLLLMRDLSPNLVPDVREPLARAQEDVLIVAIAAMHARFWSSPSLGLPWLTTPKRLTALLDARTAADRERLAILPAALATNVATGWAAALKRLPGAVGMALSEPAHDEEGLPRTLIHGDVKVANFAFLPDARVAAFDWAMMGNAPASYDLGWYLAVNASRLTRSKEDVLALYRSALDNRLPTPLPSDVWQAIEKAGIVAGARMLLWSKALAVEAGRAGAVEEWQWWSDRLELACS